MDQDSREQYQHFLLHSNVATDLLEFREAGTLRMVALIDRLADGLSSVYAFFEPEIRGASFGTYNVLWQIQRCATLGCPTCILATGSPKAARWRTRRHSGRLKGCATGCGNGCRAS
jgi:arginine-tRNA-protein transferase